ncbi:MAG: hypothetical protein RLZZ597_1456 [Cyanobacteriota bacterium]|jgi:hypothetical protein
MDEDIDYLLEQRRFKSEVQHSVSEPLSAFAVMTTTRNTVQRSTAGYRSPS